MPYDPIRLRLNVCRITMLVFTTSTSSLLRAAIISSESLVCSYAVRALQEAVITNEILAEKDD